MNRRKNDTLMLRLIMCTALVVPSVTHAQQVTVENFVRAESDYNIRASLKAAGATVGQIIHQRQPVSAKTQTVIRSNQDTLYSSVLLDLSEPAKVTMPDTGGRYMSMHVISQDHYMYVETKPGTYNLTEEGVGTRYAVVLFRTFANPRNETDVKAAQAAQDGIVVEGGASGPFDAPEWDEKALASGRKALNDFAVLGFDSKYAFGRKEETRPIDHLIGAAAGWGGLPRTAASYTVESVPNNDGKTKYAVTVKDVPVDAFWSITVYNADGYLDDKSNNVSSYNNYTAKPNPDGSYTIHFGGCDDGRENCISTTLGWNYAVRMYEPRAVILDGSWTFPKPTQTE